MQLQRYQQLIDQRDALSERAHDLLQGRPDYEALRSVPCIGPALALTILAEGGDLRRFAHHRQFLKYRGLDLAKSQSGQTRGQEKLSSAAMRDYASRFGSQRPLRFECARTAFDKSTNATFDRCS